ncbi:FAD-dependent oxidoreductase [Luteimonas sp. TWI662]|uniref:FAD/NAD(P)-binding protein n=1 Tax=unclassified Luteimonas TaxID=2629088 RepID=UPI00320AE25C
MPQSAPPDVDVAVIGGGAAGALVALHLLAAPGLRVALVEPRPRLAEGVAYSTPRFEHLLNVNAARMSAFDDRPDDFLAFLREAPAAAARPAETLPATFAPRRVYGDYLQARLAGCAQAGTLLHLAETVDAVRPAASGFALRTDADTALRARAVVLATGGVPAALPVSGASAAAPGTIDAWHYAAVAAIAPEADVAIVGAGLSMVDVLLTLHANGHRGRIVAISRHGLMPLAHAPGTVPQAGGVEPLLPLGARARMRLLRQWAAQAQAEGRPWQDALERLRPQVQALWQAWPPAEQARFLRHGVRHWDIHRHRIAPEAAAVVDTMRRDGRFSLHAGRVTAVAARDDGRWQLDWRRRRRSDGERLVVDRVVNATGLEKRPTQVPGTLPAALYAQGIARPGPHGMGIDTDDVGGVRDRSGATVPGLWTLGIPRIGTLWESIAMPELRGQAARVAAAALAHVREVGARD